MDRRQARRELFDVFGIDSRVNIGLEQITLKLEEKLNALDQLHNDSHVLLDSQECGQAQCRICEAQSLLISEIRTLLHELLRSQVSASELSSLSPRRLNFCRALLTQPSPKTARKPRKLSKPEIQTHELIWIM
ncbi:unnamed protein product [Bursaphelenchus xylophilus]|uniref:(pine wood nematode) hypothetical protein n=1 Tax=Bursaphelenchus xylophilus TaxID=6326 RepID=A0A1I7SF09_BURXY|nr:unnamed protein product [Bursaphelenchus xylophilus]CAG9088828.1 unnamed protein product [Bursaphelenchus xylophilus]